MFIGDSSDALFFSIFSHSFQYPQAKTRVFEKQPQSNPVHPPVFMLPLISANTGANSYAPAYAWVLNRHERAQVLISTRLNQRAAGNGSSGCSAPDPIPASPLPCGLHASAAPLSQYGCPLPGLAFRVATADLRGLSRALDSLPTLAASIDLPAWTNRRRRPVPRKCTTRTRRLLDTAVF